MNLDRDSVLRPLHAASDAVGTLRAGAADAGAVSAVSAAAEQCLRRLLRDDATAPVELRLRALSEDDLSFDALLAELRQRNRLPLDLAAKIHQLRNAALAGEVTPAHAALAIDAADSLDRHISLLPFPPPMGDPAVDTVDTLIPSDPGEELGHSVPISRGEPKAWGIWAGAVGALALVLIGIFWFVSAGRANDLARAETLLRSGRTAEAQAAFQQIARDHPDQAMPHFYLARIDRSAGRLNEAARELRTGLAIDPREPRLHAELGYVLLASGRPLNAVAPFRTAIAYDANAPAAWGGLVRALRESGNTVQAERLLIAAPANVRAALARVPAR